jgi:peptidylprolyl isomerase/peptidyl-prolyl cis-trans isomerase C
MMNAQAYLQLKLSLALFKKPPHSLTGTETARLDEVAERQARIETAILASPEALDVIVPQATLNTRLEEIRQRYANRKEFLDDMRRNGLDEQELEAAAARDLRIEAVLERVAAQAPEVCAADAEIYYRQHPQAFTRPETRRVRHILVTFDNETQRQAAFTLLQNLRARIETAEDFAAAAGKHSQCPTALEGGIIGTVKPGQLFPELDAAAFALLESELSLPLESPIGLHLLFCDAILPGTTLSFADARERVITRLTEQRGQSRQQNWIKALLRA